MENTRTFPRFVRSVGAIVILSVSIMFATASPAAACSCVGFVDALEFDNDFAAVFIGEVVDERSGPKGQFGDQELELTFAVERLYLGDLRNRALLYSYKDNGANCGFSGSGTIAVLAYVGEDQRLRTDGCSVTPVGSGGVIQAALETRFGQGVVPLPPEPGSQLPSPGSSDGGLPGVFIGAVLFAVALGIGFGLVLRSGNSAR